MRIKWLILFSVASGLYDEVINVVSSEYVGDHGVGLQGSGYGVAAVRVR